MQDVIELSRPEDRAELQQQVEDLQRAGATWYGGLLAIPLDTDRPDDLRSSACWFLGHLGRAEAIPVLVEATTDGHPVVREAGVRALGILGDTSILSQVIHVLEVDSDAIVRQIAAYALGMLGDVRAVTPLIRVLSKQDEGPGVRGMAAEQLGTLDDTAAVPALIAALNDAEAEIRFWSVFALGKLLDRRALPELRRLAREDTGAVPSGTVKEEAIDAIHFIETGEFS